MDFLSEIIAAKKEEVAQAKASAPRDQVRESARKLRADAEPHRLTAALRDVTRVNIIAEFKRRSPSKGDIKAQADPAATALTYEVAGAAAVSVLTEQKYFNGSLDDLAKVRNAVSLPLLQKDFIFDEYQVYESAWTGADAMLLIVAALDDATLARLRAIAEDELRMDALIEVHTKDELDRAVACGARVIGVNNRDLRSFSVSIATSEQLARHAPPEAILVSESGLNPEAVQRLHAIGYHGFLVGEAFMRATDPGEELREFMGRKNAERIFETQSSQIKICGITSAEDAHAAIDAGADMLGFNFYGRSPRFIEPKVAGAIIQEVRSRANQNTRPIAIGVFVDESIEQILGIAAEAGLDGIQLHGNETADFCRRLKSLSPERLLIKVFGSNGRIRFDSLVDYHADAIMIDAFDANMRGGTGRLADWSAAQEATRKMPRVFLAGGLTSENVAAAIATVRPYGVDACSSLEQSPGRKDAERMRQFVCAARAAYTAVEAAKTSELSGKGK
jgi:indole-3-glycerol phosphate synthase/phosphoribosylanthranilate isomerase/anthranilate synthase/indole-3-glycerol phosphate synthase/phosphoribosylanthranilate isomerase